MNAVMVGLRCDHRNPGHTIVSVFVGRNEDARGPSGALRFRTDEFDELFGPIADGQRLEIEVISVGPASPG